MRREIGLLAAFCGVIGAGAASAQGPVPAPGAPAEQIVVEATFPGPAEGTVIQRVRDVRTGTLCYLYLPAYLPPTVADESGGRMHGANSLGSISCVPAPR